MATRATFHVPASAQEYCGRRQQVSGVQWGHHSTVRRSKHCLRSVPAPPYLPPPQVVWCAKSPRISELSCSVLNVANVDTLPNLNTCGRACTQQKWSNVLHSYHFGTLDDVLSSVCTT